MNRVLVAANDPGGANAILPVVQRLHADGVEVLSLLTGPARDVFRRGGVSYIDAETLSAEERRTYVDDFQPERMLAGTSMGEQVDKELLRYLQGKVPSVYVLDFWNSYALRFSKEKNDFRYLPDCICVPDEMARQEMLKEGFPEEILYVTGNPYFEHFTEGITRSGEDRYRILFISQPVSELGEKVYGFDEFDALRGVQEVVQELPLPYTLSVRLHPRDDTHKYDSFLSDRIALSLDPRIENDISTAGLVIGMFSPVLIQAASAGKSVISFEPNLTGPDPLPTNASDMTTHAYSEKELVDLFNMYVENRFPSSPSVSLGQQGALDAVMSTLLGRV